MLLRSTLFALCLATPCLACPTSGDLSTGVEIVFSDSAGKDVTVLYKRGLEGELVASQASKDGQSHIVSASGVLPMSDFKTTAEGKVKGKARIYEYDSAFPIPPKPQSSWDGQLTEPSANGDLEPVTVEISVGAKKAGQLDDCAFTMTDVGVIYTDDGGQYMEQFAFVDELGIAVLMSYQMPLIGLTETYTPLTVRALP